jgi:hypothetical protein
MKSTKSYCKGMIIMIDESRLKRLDLDYSVDKMLVNRPLLIVSNPHILFSTITVCTITSQDRPGILVDTVDSKYTRSVILPWSLHTIHMNCISATKGVISPPMMKAVDEAVKFHMGFSDEIPPYMRSFAKEYLPEYNLANVTNVGKNSDIMNAVVKPNLSTDNFTNTNKLGEVAKIMRPALRPTTDRELPFEKQKKSAFRPVPEIKSSNILNAIDKREESKPLADNHPKRSYTRIEDIIDDFTEDDLVYILRRDYKTVKEAAKRFGVSNGTFKKLKDMIRSREINNAAYERISRILNNDPLVNFNNLTEKDKVIIAIYGANDLSKFKCERNDLLVRFINNYRDKRGIFLNNKQKWTDLSTDRYI